MPVVWQLACIQFSESTLITGVVLEGSPFTYPRPISRWQNFWKLVQSYFISAYRYGEVHITTTDDCHVTTTDAKGGFRLVLPGGEQGPVSVATPDAGPLEVLQRYPTQYPMSEGEVDVISDMDDTILVSHTASLLKRIGTMALVTPHRRKVIVYTQGVLEEYTRRGGRVFYLSKSESNLFGMLSTFLEIQELPQGPLFLTPYLKLRQLFRPQKGKDYKYNHAAFLLDHSEQKRFVLIGDDTQRDMAVYRQLALRYPDRIEKIFIRQTRSRRSSRQRRLWKELQAVGVPVAYFGPKEPAPLFSKLTQSS